MKNVLYNRIKLYKIVILLENIGYIMYTEYMVYFI